METIHDKLKENFCIPNKPRAFPHSRRSAGGNTFFPERQREIKLAISGGWGWEVALSLPVWLPGGARQGQRPGPHYCQNMQNAFFGKDEVRIRKQCLLCSSLPKTPGPRWRCPLPHANERTLLKIIYSIFNSDYTHQGDLNLITKLEGLKTNPPKSDTVD